MHDINVIDWVSIVIFIRLILEILGLWVVYKAVQGFINARRKIK